MEQARTYAPGKHFSDTRLLVETIAAAAVAGLVMLGIGGLCAWLTRNLLPAGDRIRYAECFACGFALAGAVYLCRIFANGGL